MGAPVFPNFTSPPNVGPEPAGLLAAVQSKVFGQSSPDAAPGPYDLTDRQLVDELTTTKGFCDPGRELFEYGWWRNLLYLLGRQWVYWNPTSRQWQDKRLAKWVPKPVTNIVRTTLLSIRATLQAIDLSAAARPTGDGALDLTTAQTVDDLEPVIKEEHNIGGVFQMADYTAALFGDAFLHSYWDTSDPAHTTEVGTWICAACQATSTDMQVTQAQQRCPACQSAVLRPGESTRLPIGKGKTLCVSPLELMLPLYAQSGEAVDRLVYLTWRPKHEVEDEYADLVTGDGKKLLDTIQWDQGPSQRSLQLYKAIATTSDLNLTPSVWSATAFTGQVTGTTEQHLWIKPNKRYPKGLYCRFVGDAATVPVRLTDAEGQPLGFELPYRRLVDDSPLWPWVQYAFEPLHGRLYSQGAIDAIIQKQDQINQADSMAQMTLQRMGNPIWLEQKGAAVERFTGEPGQIVRWQAVGNGGKPERMAGENPPASLFTLRDQYKADAEELAGTYDVLKGEKPSGVEAFAALNLLVERSQSRFQTTFKSRGKAYRDWLANAVELERSYGPTTRTRAVLGPNKSWTFQKFQKADLDGNITLTMTDASSIPKTALARRAAIEHANQLGAIKITDDNTRFRLLNELGVPFLSPDLEADVESALREQSAFEEWVTAGMQGPSPLVRYPWQKDEVHLSVNRMWMNSDFVQELLASLKNSPDQQGVITILGNHLAEHAVNLQTPQLPVKTQVTISPSKDLIPGTPQFPAAAQLAGIHPMPGASVPGPGPQPPPGSLPPNAGQPPPAKPGGAGMAMANSNQNAGGTSAAHPPPGVH